MWGEGLHLAQYGSLPLHWEEQNVGHISAEDQLVCIIKETQYTNMWAWSTMCIEHSICQDSTMSSNKKATPLYNVSSPTTIKGWWRKKQQHNFPYVEVPISKGFLYFFFLSFSLVNTYTLVIIFQNIADYSIGLSPWFSPSPNTEDFHRNIFVIYSSFTFSFFFRFIFSSSNTSIHVPHGSINVVVETQCLIHLTSPHPTTNKIEMILSSKKNSLFIYSDPGMCVCVCRERDTHTHIDLEAIIDVQHIMNRPDLFFLLVSEKWIKQHLFN